MDYFLFISHFKAHLVINLVFCNTNTQKTSKKLQKNGKKCESAPTHAQRDYFQIQFQFQFSVPVADVSFLFLFLFLLFFFFFKTFVHSFIAFVVVAFTAAAAAAAGPRNSCRC